MKYIKPIALILVAGFVVLNQVQIVQAAMMLGVHEGMSGMMVRTFTGDDSRSAGGQGALGDVELSSVTSTAQGIAAIFPLQDITTSADAIAMMVPQGTPSYGEAMGVSFDTPEQSLAVLAKAQRPLLASLTPEQKARFVNFASQPLGISCEYCCGLQAVGINADGTSLCGCQHNPALLSVTMWLMQNTNYSDAEILREVYRWKSLFFPKDMTELALKIAGGDTSVLQDLPGMVGGC